MDITELNDQLRAEFVKDSITAAILALRPTLGRDFDFTVNTTGDKSALKLTAHNELGRMFIEHVSQHVQQLMEDIDEYKKRKHDTEATDE